jgi:5-methylcytosine-specific restriction endonuclease McrA
MTDAHRGVVRRHLTQSERLLAYLLSRGRCHWCDVRLGVAFDVDHLHPLGQGGPETWINRRATCPHCNRSRGKRS